MSDIKPKLEQDLRQIDCRSCQYFDNARARCRSITTCVNAENYKGVPLIQLWTEKPKMLGRIKVGAFITQDFGSGLWPATKRGIDVDPDMEFECEWKGSFWDCRADGYGMLRSLGDVGDYGNGSVFVHEREGVIASSLGTGPERKDNGTHIY